MFVIRKFLKVKNYYEKKIKKVQKEELLQNVYINKDCIDVIREMAWKYYEAEISRGNKLVSKANIYCGSVSLTLSFFSFVSKEVLVSVKEYNFYQMVLIGVFLVTIFYFLFAAISALMAVRLTKMHKIGDCDIKEIKGVGVQHQKSYDEKLSIVCKKRIIELLIWYTKLNEQNDNAIATYVGISQECYYKGILGMIIFLMMKYIHG